MGFIDPDTLGAEVKNVGGFIDTTVHTVTEPIGVVKQLIGGLVTPPGRKEVSYESYSALQGKAATMKAQAQSKELIRLWDKNFQFITSIEVFDSLEYEEILHNSGSATLVVKAQGWLDDFFRRHIRPVEDVHITIEPRFNRGWRHRWGGKVKDIAFTLDEKGHHTITLSCVHHYEHMKKILIGANPVFPFEIQIPRMFILPGPCRSICSTALFINLARNFEPLLALPDHFTNPAFWITDLNLLNISPLNWPVQVAWCNPVTDQSPWTVLGAAWQDAHSVMDPILTDAGCHVRAYTWLPEDDDTPHQDFNTLTNTLSAAGAGIGLLANTIGKAGKTLLQEINTVSTNLLDDIGFRASNNIIIDAIGNIIGIAGAGGQWISQHASDTVGRVVNAVGRPWRPCVVLSVENTSGVTGPTGTMIDGLVTLVASTADDFISTIITPQTTNSELENTNSKPASLIRSLTGTAPEKPWPIFREGETSPIISSTKTVHKPQARTIVVGGKSPKIVNDSITFGITYGLSWLSELLYAPTGLAVGSFNGPGTMGLDNLYQGYLDDTILTYMSATDIMLANMQGDYAFIESREGSTATAYGLSGFLNLRQGMWKNRAYTSAKVTMKDGAPYLYGIDYQLGQRVGFQLGEIIYTDQIAAYKYTTTKNQPKTLSISIGDDTGEEDPVTQGLRLVNTVWNAIAALAGQSNIFN